MANQPEQTVYDPGVYQLEVTDPVKGGLGGLANKPLLNLANRTNYLLTQVNLLANEIAASALVNSPNLTGSPTVPNVAGGDMSLLIANTAFVHAATNGAVTVNVAGNVNVVLGQTQWSAPIIIFTGALTGDVNVIFPAQSGAWIVSNLTTGAYKLTVATAAGVGVVVTQGRRQGIFGDGASIRPDFNDISVFNSSDIIAALGFTPVQQGGGVNQLANKIYWGWDGQFARLTVDATDEGEFASKYYNDSTYLTKATFNANVNQGVRTVDSPTFNALTATTVGAACPPPGPGAMQANTFWMKQDGTANPRLAIADAGSGIVRIQAGGNGQFNWTFGPAGNATATSGSFVSASDERDKDDIVTLEAGLTIIRNLRGVGFVRRETGAREFGVIAQEVQAVAPEVVHVIEHGVGAEFLTDAEGEVILGEDGRAIARERPPVSKLGVNYNGLIGPLIEAVKALADQCDALRADVVALQAQGASR